MTNSEKIAYIRGLAEGLELDPSKKEVKVLNAIIEALEDMALSISDTEENLKEMLTFANAAASIVTTRKGALRVMPEREEVEALIASGRGE